MRSKHKKGVKLKPKKIACSLIVSGFLLSGCGDSDGAKTSLEEVNTSAKHFIHVKVLGGDTTDVEFTSSTHAFSQPAANLKGELFDLHMEGDTNFETSFYGPNDGSDYLAGLGPVQNHVNCDACHQKDGRANLPVLEHMPHLNSHLFQDENGYYKLGNAGVFLRISIENSAINSAKKSESNCWGSPVPVPNFSDQLFHRGSIGVRVDEDNNTISQGTGQADVWMKYEYKTVTYPDGTTVELSKPLFFVDNPYDAPDDPNVYNPITVEENATSRLFKPDVKFGPRIGMPMIGLGLLAAIDERDILALADENDTDGDGISGKPNWVCDKEKLDKCKAENNCEQNRPISLGRFGWKANTPTVAHQGLGALRGDMGVTNPLFKMESIAKTDLMKEYKARNPNFKTYCDTNKTDTDLEFSKAVIFYAETLSVPPRRNIDDPDVKQGGMIFEQIGCAKCHHPSFTTGTKYVSFSRDGKRIKELENQKIYPFTDMLLHDMGPDLADGRRDFDASGSEWKTRPLWGIGATQIVNPGAGFLHDGRARTLEEAILWHGGEAEAIKNSFMNLNKTKRNQLIKFLESL